MLIFQHFLICYFICPAELCKEQQTSFSFSLPDPGGRLIDLDFMISVLSASFPLFLSPSLCASSISPTLCFHKYLYSESDSSFLPWSARGWGEGVSILLKLRQKRKHPGQDWHTSPQVAILGIFSPLFNMVLEVKCFPFF